MTRAVTNRVKALENAIGTGRVTVYLPVHVEDEAKTVEGVLRRSGYDPAITQVVCLWLDDMVDDLFGRPGLKGCRTITVY